MASLTVSFQFFAVIGSYGIVSYNILYNATASIEYLPNLLVALDSAILSLAASDPHANFTASTRSFPHLRPRDYATSVVSSSGALFLMCPALFNVMVFMYQITAERERRLDVGLRANGMRQSAYFVSWALTHAFFVIVNTLVMEAMGQAFGFSVFRSADVSVTLAVFAAFGASLLALAYFLNVFIRSAKTAAIIGFLILVIGLFLQLIFTGDQVYSFFDPGTTPFIGHLLQAFPPFAFAKCFRDISRVIGVSDGVSQTVFFTWADLFRVLTVDTGLTSYPVATTANSLLHMLVAGLVFTALFLYLNAVIPRDGHPGLHPLFFVLPSTYGCCVPSAEQQPLLARSVDASASAGT